MNSYDISFDWRLVGNDHIKEFLEKSILNNKVAGAYIFNGPDNLGKTTLALNFAKILLCESTKNSVGDLPCNSCSACRLIGSKRKNSKQTESNTQESMYTENIHGDLHVIKCEKDKKNISVTQVRELIKTLGMSSFLNSYKIGVIKHADSMNEEAANALLKTLEEPKDKVVIILVSTNLDSLPTTVKSRSQLLNFQEVNTDSLYEHLLSDESVDRVRAKNISRLSLGRPALARKFSENNDFYETYIKRANVFVDFFRKDVNSRFSSIDELIDKKQKGQELAKQVNRILEIWQGLSRDLVLIKFGHKDLVQHQLQQDSLSDISNSVSIKGLIGISKKLNSAKRYLKANISPRLVLEFISLNI